MTAAELKVVTSVAFVERLLIDGASWWRIREAERAAQEAVDALGPATVEDVRDLIEIGEHVGQRVPL